MTRISRVWKGVGNGTFGTQRVKIYKRGAFRKKGWERNRATSYSGAEITRSRGRRGD